LVDHGEAAFAAIYHNPETVRGVVVRTRKSQDAAFVVWQQRDAIAKYGGAIW
jgi:hypothetical protein